MNVYTSYYSSLVGLLKIQANEQQVLSILFEEDKPIEETKTDLLQLCITQLDEYFEGNRLKFNLPLGQTGTPFQEQVWNQLMTIPFGKTTSYLNLSKQMGNVKAIRAIAAANGKNKLAIIVPCHRVIGSNTTLVGYAGGLWRKKWLLEHEAKQVIGIGQISLFS